MFSVVLFWVGELLMGFRDLAILPSSASISITFLKNCGICESLRTTTCPKTVVGVSKGMLPVRYFAPQGLFLYQSNIMDIIRLLKG